MANKGISMMTTAMIMAASLVGLITGYTVPLISLELSKQDVDVATIGVMAALPATGMMFSCFAAPKLLRMFNVTWLVSVNLLFLVIATVISCLTSDVFMLVIPRLLTGVTSGILVVLGESWVTGRSSSKHRATLTGLYTSMFTGCQLLGPLLLTGGDAFQLPMLIGISMVVVMCIFVLRNASVSFENEASSSINWRSLSSLLPVLATGVLCFSFFDASILSLFPLYGIEQGINEQYAITLVAIILIGDAVFQVPIGYFADRIGVRKTHIMSGVIFCIMIFLLPFLFHSLVLLIIGCLILGAFAGALYTLSLVHAGMLLTGHKLIMMNAILGLVWSAGSISGPLISGGAISLAGYNGMIGVLFLIGVLFVGSQLLCLPKPARNKSQ